MAYRREKWKEYGSTLFQIILSFALLTSVHGSCGPLPKLLYAAPMSLEMANKTNFSDGEQVRYICRPGYSRNSSRVTLTCRDNSWYPTTPFCVKKRCHHPGELNNGKVFIKTDLEFGSKIEFSCLDGYNLIGSSTSTCEIFETGVTWSDPIPQCEIIVCPPPPHISNGKHSNREDEIYSFGSSVTYRCNPSFSLIGEASISCTVVDGTIGTWSPQPPVCKKVICKQPEFPNGKLTSGLGPLYTYRDTVMLECNRGYLINGSNMIHCGADNQWIPDIPTCEINACTKQPVIANADLEPYYRFENVFPVGTVLTFTCKNGYKATPDTPLTATCQKDFSWQMKGGFCERICCPSPVINNGKILQFINDCKYVPMRRIKIQCEGYQQESICQQDGTWKPEITSCDSKRISDCNSPKTIANGNFTINEGYFDVSVNYFCNDGYVLIGKSTNICRFSKWANPFPHCQALCPKPKVSNGKLFSEKFQYLSGEKVNIQCSPGYHLLGSQNITCSENRSWIPEVPKCEWEFSEGCEKVSVGYKLMQCLPNSQDVKLALEIEKLSLEIELLKQAIGKNKMNSKQESSSQSCTHKIEKDPQTYPYY
ncbi:C4b-binding protein alpha chain [Sarcophilus harrisii]|uniref:Complement component 4 binding protein alpha n=1 Tax=Sarcophilus harrisii TaxID=9305 RepID=G3X2N5_SARHA|nr:C4b-binding protein alpha chain [Sarcophilus harrisii]